MFDNTLETKNALNKKKDEKLKKIEKWDFFKGVSPWFWSKMSNVAIFLFFAKYAQKMCLTIFWKKNALKTIKTKT